MNDRPVTHLNFSGEAFVFLRFERIWKIGELLERSRQELEASPTPSSPQLLDHIEHVLAENRLKLKQS